MTTYRKNCIVLSVSTLFLKGKVRRCEGKGREEEVKGMKGKGWGEEDKGIKGKGWGEEDEGKEVEG